MAVAVEIVRTREENVVKQVTRDGEDGNLSMRDQVVIPKPAELKASQNTTPTGSDKISPVNVYTMP